MFGMSRMTTEVLKLLAASLAVSSISSGSEALTLLQRLLLSMTFQRVNTHYCTAKVRQYVPTAVQRFHGILLLRRLGMGSFPPHPPRLLSHRN